MAGEEVRREMATPIKGTIQRLWRPRAIANVVVPLLIVAAIAVVDGYVLKTLRQPWHDAVHYAVVFVAALVACYVVSAFSREVIRVLDVTLGLGRARSMGTFISVLLYCIVILMAMNAVGFNLSGLLVGGALTGVILGIAGQTSLANIISGVVILFARPYSDGMYITVRAGAFGGVEYSGRVWYVSLFHTILYSGDEQIRVPNSIMVNAVIVLRPQELDVYIPITLPLSTDLPPLLERLRREIADCATPPLTPHVVLESVADTGYKVGVRVFVAGARERHAVEQVVATVTRAMEPTPEAACAPGAAEPESAVE